MQVSHGKRRAILRPLEPLGIRHEMRVRGPIKCLSTTVWTCKISVFTADMLMSRLHPIGWTSAHELISHPTSTGPDLWMDGGLPEYARRPEVGRLVREGHVPAIQVRRLRVRRNEDELILLGVVLQAEQTGSVIDCNECRSCARVCRSRWRRAGNSQGLCRSRGSSCSWYLNKLRLMICPCSRNGQIMSILSAEIRTNLGDWSILLIIYSATVQLCYRSCTSRLRIPVCLGLQVILEESTRGV